MNRLQYDEVRGVLAHLPSGAWERLPLIPNVVAEFHDVNHFQYCFAHNGVRWAYANQRLHVACQYLAMRCVGVDKPYDQHIQKFGRVLAHVLEKGLIVGRMMEAPLWLPLATTNYVAVQEYELRRRGFPSNEPEPAPDPGEPQGVLVAYVHSVHSRETLNKIVGFEAFVDEGKLMSEWP